MYRCSLTSKESATTADTSGSCISAVSVYSPEVLSLEAESLLFKEKTKAFCLAVILNRSIVSLSELSGVPFMSLIIFPGALNIWLHHAIFCSFSRYSDNVYVCGSFPDVVTGIL